ncbi:spectrin beta chain [Anaeramoeba flamelloides]|uniref:Spectrin beta chain n=1 Tax=Anaeramoeba flamelloides TaxID=1746091 RepID=A0AAV7YGJ1_9EUKA|nr:spectrin beta chain [Anaeramoeba flamelloides]
MISNQKKLSRVYNNNRKRFLPKLSKEEIHKLRFSRFVRRKELPKQLQARGYRRFKRKKIVLLPTKLEQVYTSLTQKGLNKRLLLLYHKSLLKNAQDLGVNTYGLNKKDLAVSKSDPISTVKRTEDLNKPLFQQSDFHQKSQTFYKSLIEEEKKKKKKKSQAQKIEIKIEIEKSNNEKNDPINNNANEKPKGTHHLNTLGRSLTTIEPLTKERPLKRKTLSFQEKEIYADTGKKKRLSAPIGTTIKIGNQDEEGKRIQTKSENEKVNKKYTQRGAKKSVTKENEIQNNQKQSLLIKQQEEFEKLKLEEIKATVVRVYFNDDSWKTLRLEPTDTVGKLIKKTRNKTFDKDTTNFVLIERKGKVDRILDERFNAWFIKKKWCSQDDDFNRFVFLNPSKIEKKNVLSSDEFIISRIYFEDETHKTLKINRKQIALDIVKIVCSKIFIKEFYEYSLYVKNFSNCIVKSNSMNKIVCDNNGFGSNNTHKGDITGNGGNDGDDDDDNVDNNDGVDDGEDDGGVTFRLCEDDENIYTLIKDWEIRSENSILLFKDREYQKPKEDQVEYQGKLISKNLLLKLKAEEKENQQTSNSSDQKESKFQNTNNDKISNLMKNSILSEGNQNSNENSTTIDTTEEIETEKNKIKKLKKFSKFKSRFGNKKKKKMTTININQNELTRNTTKEEAEPVAKIKGDKYGKLNLIQFESNTGYKAQRVYLSLQGKRCFYFLNFKSTTPSGNFSLLNSAITQDQNMVKKLNLSNCFTILTMKGESLTFQCQDPNEFNNWFETISKNIINTGQKKDPRSMMAKRKKLRSGSITLTKNNKLNFEEQKICFTNWINWQLSKNTNTNSQKRRVENLEKDLSDGVILAQLFESLTSKTLKIITKPKFLTQKLDNLNQVLTSIQNNGINLHLINEEDVIEGRINSILLLIWLLIYKLLNNGLSRTNLLQWVREKLSSLNITVGNFESGFQSALIFNSLLYNHNNNLTNPNGLDPNDFQKNWQLFISNMESCYKIPPLFIPKDFKKIPDSRVIMTLVFVIKQYVYHEI